MKESVFITGVAESELGEVTDSTELAMVAAAARDALSEAGLSFADVDGLFVAFTGEDGTVEVGEYLGVRPRYADSSHPGGGAFQSFIHHAVGAIEAGRCEVALLAFASRQRSRAQRSLGFDGDPDSLAGQFEAPYGLPVPLGHHALIAARYLHEYGATSEQLAAVAVAARSWAQLNPKAWKRAPITTLDVLSSPMICSPLRRLDCCLVTDGGGAAVVTGAGPADSATKPRVRIVGAGESHTHVHITEWPGFGHTAGRHSAIAALAEAGIGPDEIDFVEPYDATTIAVLIALEELGICPQGEAGALAESGALGPGGSLPAMTTGGGLSYCHPGALGLLLLIEAVRQLRGECGPRQVEDPRIAVTHGVGGASFSSAGTVVLTRE